jgi:hypothetical protein
MINRIVSVKRKFWKLNFLREKRKLKQIELQTRFNCVCSWEIMESDTSLILNSNSINPQNYLNVLELLIPKEQKNVITIKWRTKWNYCWNENKNSRKKSPSTVMEIKTNSWKPQIQFYWVCSWQKNKSATHHTSSIGLSSIQHCYY